MNFNNKGAFVTNSKLKWGLHLSFHINMNDQVWFLVGFHFPISLVFIFLQYELLRNLVLVDRSLSPSLSLAQYHLSEMEFVSPEGLRLDGRRPTEMRQLRAEIGVISKADGSAMFEMGNTKVIAAVYGPREVQNKGQQIIDHALVRCEYSMANFSTGDRLRKPKGDRRSIEISLVIRQTMEACIMTHLMPRSQIDIFVQVLQADGGTRSACINAATLALADAGIPMCDLVTSCSAGYLNSTPLLDLNYIEDSAGGADVTVGILPTLDKVTLLQMDAKLPTNIFEDVMLANYIREVLVENTKQLEWEEDGGWSESFGALRDGKNVTYLIAELITALPGQPTNVSFKQHSGYINVTDAHHGSTRALFYYFVEAQSPDPVSLPLTLWLNGGPGCSSLGFGAFMEHGPFQPGKNGILLRNKYSWNLAEDNLRFIVKWLEEFPQYEDSDFFLTGESYAGHYIPQLASLLMEYNKQPNIIRPIKLKAIALGNPLLDLDISVLSGEYLWSHGAISDETLRLEKKVCNDSKYLHEFVHKQRSQECNNVFKRVSDEVGDDIDRTDLLSPLCLPASFTQQFKAMGKHGEIHSKFRRFVRFKSNFYSHEQMARKGIQVGDPCLGDRILNYLNQPQVQKALHANTTHLPYHWDFCSGSFFFSLSHIYSLGRFLDVSPRTPLVYQDDSFEINIIPLISNLIIQGIPILLYSGDQDTKIPLTQTRIIANILAKELKLVPFTTYANWYDKNQVGGWSQSFGRLTDGKNVTYLTFATVRGAAHEVPFTSPSQALTLFRSFLAGSPLPRPN
ncbi:hypothetical protein EZV62_016982 [Acer yangbiense]|uniref:Uncharacterized protein n=1 Tax=Acer yangbiense TaxID=1000413 RepID=A0A5C7HQ05_9ROSI|nr:hypothetical protein EZV62_016982 [Acer yangbiense]